MLRRDDWQARLAPLPAARDRTAGDELRLRGWIIAPLELIVGGSPPGVDEAGLLVFSGRSGSGRVPPC